MIRNSKDRILWLIFYTNSGTPFIEMQYLTCLSTYKPNLGVQILLFKQRYLKKILASFELFCNFATTYKQEETCTASNHVQKIGHYL
jgi:hypothetical protein